MPTCGATATSPTSGNEKPPREPVLKGLLGLGLLRDSRLPGFPRATCDFPGYAYDAEVRGARLAARSGRAPLRRAPREGGRRPERRFNRDFWVADGVYFALALDADGAQVDALSSTSATCCGAASSTRTRPGRSRAPDGLAAVLGLGRAHPGRRPGPLHPDRLPRRHHLALRQLVHRLGLRNYGFKERPHASPPASSTRPSSSMAGCRRPSAATRASRPSTRCSTPRPAAPRPGRPGRRCSCYAPCWPRTDRRSSGRRPGPASGHRPPGTARHPGTLGAHRRLREGHGRRRQGGRARGQLGVLSQSEVKRTARPREHKH